VKRFLLVLVVGLLGPAYLAAQEPAPAPVPKPTPAPAPPAARPPVRPLAKGARLRGVVLKAEDGLPLPSADITLLGMEQSIRAGEDGRFDFGALEPGPYIVQARYLGYSPYTVRAELADSSALDLVFRMNRQAVQLEDITVKIPPKVNRFTERLQESNGFGTFITRKQIEERNTPFICDLLRGRLGLRVISAGAGCQIRVARAQGLSFQRGDCAPLAYIDGARADISQLESNSYPTTNLEGVELYRSSAEAPAEFNAGNGCGVVALWSRNGR